MEIIKEKEDLYNNRRVEKVYYTNGEMVLHFQTIKDREEFQKLIDRLFWNFLDNVLEKVKLVGIVTTEQLLK